MHTSQSTAPTRRTLIVLGVTIIAITTFGLLWLQPDARSRFSGLHISTSRAHSVTFERHPELVDLTHGGDANWTALLPPNGGFVSQPSKDGSGYEMAGISMFHQLHCLGMIRTAIQDLKYGKDETNGADKKKATTMGKINGLPVYDDEEDDFGVRRRRSVRMEKEHGAHDEHKHWLHCLDYLVQSILCAADDTIEYAHDNALGGGAVDGYGVTHQCRSADALWAKVMGKMSTPGWKAADELKG